MSSHRNFLVVAASLFLFQTALLAAGPAIDIVAPRGGEVFVIGQAQQVKVVSKFKSISIEISRDGGATFIKLGTIDNSVKDTAKRNVLAFTVSAPVSTNCIIRATGTSGKASASAISGAFSIVVSLDSGGGVLADGSVTTPKLADKAVTAVKVNSGASSDGLVLTADGAGGADYRALSGLADGAVSTAKIADKAVTAAKVGSGAATSGQVLLADGTGGVSFGLASLTSGVSGILPVLNGGTGTNNGSITGSGGLTFTAGGTNQNVTLSSSGTGAVVLKPGANSALGAQIQNAAGTAIVAVDTLNNQVKVTGSATQALTAFEVVNVQGFPSFSVEARNQNTASTNNFIGRNAGAINANGSGNTFVGDSAGEMNSGGTNSTFIGAGAGTTHSGGVSTFVGALAGNTATGIFNTFVGFEAGKVSTGSGNVFMGQAAGKSNTSGATNTFAGSLAGVGNLTGSNNVFMGSGAGVAHTTGNFNTFIGANTSDPSTTVAGSILLGANATTSTNNRFVVGSFNSTIQKAFMGEGEVASATGEFELNASAAGVVNTFPGWKLALSGGKGTGGGQPGGSVNIRTTTNNANPVDRVIVTAQGITSLFKGVDAGSGANLTVTGNVFHVTGTGTITSVVSTGINAGTTITMIFDGALTVTDNNTTLNLAGNFVTTANDTLTLVFDGVNWYEVARSVN